MGSLTLTPVQYAGGTLRILDQTQLPGREAYIEIQTAEEMWHAIRTLQVRGAPAIGVAAAYGLYRAVRDLPESDAAAFARAVRDTAAYLETARPTAVNLAWALRHMTDRLDAVLQPDIAADADVLQDVHGADTPKDARPADALQDVHGADAPKDTRPADILQDVHGADAPKDARPADATDAAAKRDPDMGVVSRAKAALLAEADAIRREDEAACYAMGEHGLSLLRPGMGILTHCNAGTIATARYGTCLAPIYLGQERGYGFHVFADETRPLLQGARLTAWELQRAGVDVTLICDNMASIVMRNGWIDAVVTGCDRMAANGDGANKIGTSGVAILAKAYGIPFYMYAPTSTIDWDTPTGAEIPIELRDGAEIRTLWYAQPMAPDGVKTYNPAFDVTDASYITAVVTEYGVIYPPYTENLAKLRRQIDR